MSPSSSTGWRPRGSRSAPPIRWTGARFALRRHEKAALPTSAPTRFWPSRSTRWTNSLAPACGRSSPVSSWRCVRRNDPQRARWRLGAPPVVAGGVVMAIAAGGFIVNVAAMRVLSGGSRSANLNMRGAWLHVATDALGNLGTVAAGAAVVFLGWRWADPVASVLIAGLVCWSAWALLSESLDVLMEGTPSGIDPDLVRAALAAIGGVLAVHDLHIWSIASGRVSLSAHVAVDGTRSHREVLQAMCVLLREDFRT